MTVIYEVSKIERMELLSQLKLIILNTNRFCNISLESDSNSKYFHSLIKWKRMKNEIKGVEIQGVWKEDPTVVKEVVKEFYENILSATDGLKLRFDNMIEY